VTTPPAQEKPIAAPATAKPEIIAVTVAVATVPGGELRVAFNLGEYTIALRLEDALTFSRHIQDCCQKIIDASLKKVSKADLQ
jgi:hypothetical protein